MWPEHFPGGSTHHFTPPRIITMATHKQPEKTKNVTNLPNVLFQFRSKALLIPTHIWKEICLLESKMQFKCFFFAEMQKPFFVVRSTTESKAGLKMQPRKCWKFRQVHSALACKLRKWRHTQTHGETVSAWLNCIMKPVVQFGGELTGWIYWAT